MQSYAVPRAPDGQEPAQTDTPVDESRLRRPAQSVSAARQAMEGAHHARPNPVERPCGGYMIGGGTFGGGFMLGSGN